MPATNDIADIEVDVPDLGTVSFPGTMSPDEIEGVLKRRFSKPGNEPGTTVPKLKLPEGVSEPPGDDTVSESLGHPLSVGANALGQATEKVGAGLINLPVELWNADTA